MKRFLLTLFLSTGMLLSSAHAGLFDDDEARRAILDLRKKVDAITEQLSGKSDKTVILDQLNQLGSLQEEIAKLRGQVEVLTNNFNELQRQQKDFYADLDARLAKFEPQKIIVDGKESQIDSNEKKSYDAALEVFQAGGYAAAANALQKFIRAYPRSAYVPNAQYSLGIAYYAQKNYKGAVASFQSLIKTHPNHSKAPDAMLNMASCYLEQRDNNAAKKMLQRLRTEYPDSTAAKTAVDRLAALK
jgi:tol-pal system protein YbgF